MYVKVQAPNWTEQSENLFSQSMKWYSRMANVFLNRQRIKGWNLLWLKIFKKNHENSKKISTGNLFWKWQQNVVSGKDRKHGAFFFKLIKKRYISHNKTLV